MYATFTKPCSDSVCTTVPDKGVQCSVCMEDFKLEEVVKELPCNHLYHPDCIVPWLEMVSARIILPCLNLPIYRMDYYHMDYSHIEFISTAVYILYINDR